MNSKLTFERESIPSPLGQLSITCEPLAHEFLMLLLVLLLVLTPPPKILVVVEDGSTDCLFSTVLAHDIFVHTPFQITRVELRHSEIYFSKHGATARFLCRIIASGKAGAKVRRLLGSKRRIYREMTAIVAWQHGSSIFLDGGRAPMGQ